MNASVILLIILFFGIIKGNAQSDTTNTIYSLSAKVGYASIWTGRGSLQQFTQDHPWSIQLDIGSLKNSRRSWNYCNCYSENGLSLGYINFANPDKLGQAIIIAGYTEPYLVLKKRFHFSLRANAGLAFLSKVYDSISNKENIFFSTKLSFILGLGANFTWQLNQNWNLTTSVQFNHISNAGRKDPNEGMNFSGIIIGVNYVVNPQKLEQRTKTKFTDKTTSLVVHGFGNIRTAWADANWPEERSIVVGANIGLIKRLSRIVGVGAGGEYYYDGINEVYQQRSGQNIQTGVGGLCLQNYLFFGKLLFGQHFAWYITPNTGFQKNIYQRYLLEYEVKRNWYAGVTLKAHGDHSDYLAFSVGYLLKIN